MDDFPTKHLTISGTVQGVFYRASMKEKADALGIAGWCRNMPDGRVEAMVQGAPEDVQALIGWATKGPAAARVEEVGILDTRAEAFSGFEIR